VFEERASEDDRATSTVLDALRCGIEAAHPRSVLAETVVRSGNVLQIHGDSYDLDRYDRVVVLGGGNAAGQIASYLADLLGDYLDDGVVVTDDPVSAGPVEVIEGTHPLPSRENVAGTERLLERARATGPDTLALVAISGGDSALLSTPADGISISELRELTDQLLQSGAAIDQINTVRKYVSNVKGGKLARELSQSDVVGLLFSDVSSNDPSVIASGPLSPDRSTFADAKAVVSELTMDTPHAMEGHLRGCRAGNRTETPGPSDPVFDSVETYILADGFTPLAAAREACKQSGVTPVILSASIRGEAREVAKTHVAIAEEIRRTGNPVSPPPGRTPVGG